MRKSRSNGRPWRNLFKDAIARARGFCASRKANVALIFALSSPIMVLLVLGGTDVSMALNAKNNLQNATDAAALAVSAATVQNPNTLEATLRSTAQSMLSQNYVNAIGPVPTITGFHVCAPVQNDCTSGGVTLPMDTVSMTTSASAPCTLCIGGGASKTVTASTTTVIGFGSTIQLNIAMDSSASMIVGATTADVTTISNWVTANWNAVKPNDPPPYTSNDDPPCAFACHDEGGNTTLADIAQGLTNAHAAGATTRFDVMTSAAQQLVNSVQTETANSTILARNTYVFNIYSFDTAIHQYGTTNMSYAAALSAIGKVSLGLDTHLSTVLPTLISTVGANGSGASASSPIKFLILVTDGLQSDRSADWTCNSWGYDPNWNWGTTCFNGYATSISQAQCTQIKNNGVVLAVLETPYVPLTGQDPHEYPYEDVVRHTIYPGGPNSTSAISTGLQNCATSGYYFQATNASQIATGFLTLTNQFLSQTAYISK